MMGIQVMDGDVILQVNLAKDDQADEVIANITKGLKAARADLRRAASGLVVANGLEVPDGFRKPKGRV